MSGWEPAWTPSSSSPSSSSGDAARSLGDKRFPAIRKRQNQTLFYTLCQTEVRKEGFHGNRVKDRPSSKVKLTTTIIILIMMSEAPLLEQRFVLTQCQEGKASAISKSSTKENLIEKTKELSGNRFKFSINKVTADLVSHYCCFSSTFSLFSSSTPYIHKSRRGGRVSNSKFDQNFFNLFSQILIFIS